MGDNIKSETNNPSSLNYLKEAQSFVRFWKAIHNTKNDVSTVVIHLYY